MSRDIGRLRKGEPIPRRHIDWATVEPTTSSAIEPCPVIIIEGIYAMAPEITKVDDLLFEVDTPLATCIGRRLLRDMRERPQFADPVASLQYMHEEAEPAYRAQSRSRPLPVHPIRS